MVTLVRDFDEDEAGEEEELHWASSPPRENTTQNILCIPSSSYVRVQKKIQIEEDY